MSKLLLRSIFIIFLAIGLGACGGGGTAGQDSSGVGDGGDAGDGGDETPDTVKMGVQVGHDFSEGTLQIADNEILSSDSTTVTVYLVDEDDFPITAGVNRVTFSSTCVEANPPTATITTDVLNVSEGIATATYTTDGCTGTDTITARATFDGEPLTASGEVVIVGANIIKIGRFTGDIFEEDLLDISVDTLSAGGSASITAYIVDADNLPITDGSVEQVEFSSDCTLANQSTITSPVPLSVGRATATYTATGCVDGDEITARAITSSGPILAKGTITVAAAEIGSIRFIDVDPATISLSGSGSGQATSVVTFELRNSAGGIMGDQNVRFSLDTTQGGLTLEPETAISGSTDGRVSTTVTSGTVPTPVVVTATVVDTDISAESVGLAVESGPPDWDSFDLSTPILNPEVWGWSGYEQQITARLSDHFNNHVPDGTAVTFIPESGSVSGSCTTVDGACSVTWVSKNPVPEQNGRASILAYAIGEESFDDANGDGLFNMYDSDGDDIPDTLETFYDKSELWWDWDEDGCRDTESVSVCTAGDAVMSSLSLETPIDFGGAANGDPNGQFDSPHPTDPNGAPVGDDIYNGSLCDDTSCADAPKNINVGRLLPIVLSGNTPMWSWVDTPVTDDSGCILLEEDDPVTLNFRITDERYQQMPAGSEVEISVSGANISSATLQAYSVWPNTNEYPVRPFLIRLRGQANTDSSGSITITVETPGFDQSMIQDDDNTTTTIGGCITLRDDPDRG